MSALAIIESVHLLGIGLALFAAFMAAVQYLFLRIGTVEGHPFEAVFVVLCVNAVLFLPTVGIYYYPTYHLTRTSIVAFLTAGVCGTLLGRIFMYSSVQRIGASRTAPIVSTWALVATILGVIVLNEILTIVHAVGVVLVVTGIAAIAWDVRAGNEEMDAQGGSLVYFALPIAASFAFGAEPILATFGFAEGTPAPVGLALKTVAALVGFTLYLHWRGGFPDLRIFRSGDSHWFILVGIANTFFIFGYYLSLEITPVSIVTPIVITYTLFVVVLSAIFMPNRLEYISLRLLVAAVVVVLGVLAISVSEWIPL